MVERVGFIGLGAMGRPMASNLVRKGFALTVFDIDAAATRPLIALGAKAAKSIVDVVHEADIVFTMLPDSPDVEAAVLGEGGIAGAGRDGLLVVDMSTIDPATTDKVAKALGEKGVGFADAPVGRLVMHAERGESLFMVGASGNDFGRIRPMLEAMGTTIHHCGAPGTGIRTKLVNNYVAIAVCQVNAEAFALARAFGLDLSTTLDVVNGTTATNGHLKTAWPNKVLVGDTAPGFKIGLAHKDMSLGIEAARKAGVPVFAGAAVRECLGLAKATSDFAGRDFSALLDHVCSLAGLSPPRLEKK